MVQGKCLCSDGPINKKLIYNEETKQGREGRAFGAFVGHSETRGTFLVKADHFKGLYKYSWEECQKSLPKRDPKHSPI
jgi:hypothetical protein